MPKSSADSLNKFVDMVTNKLPALMLKSGRWPAPGENSITVKEADSTLAQNEARQSMQLSGDVKYAAEIMEKGDLSSKKCSAANAGKRVTSPQFVEPERSMKSTSHKRTAA